MTDTRKVLYICKVIKSCENEEHTKTAFLWLKRIVETYELDMILRYEIIDAFNKTGIKGGYREKIGDFIGSI